MAPNRPQTFMTPAAQKSAVYHLWDFVGRTLQFFYMVDCEKAMHARRGKDKVSSFLWRACVRACGRRSRRAVLSICGWSLRRGGFSVAV